MLFRSLFATIATVIVIVAVLYRISHRASHTDYLWLYPPSRASTRHGQTACLTSAARCRLRRDTANPDHQLPANDLIAVGLGNLLLPRLDDRITEFNHPLRFHAHHVVMAFTE